MVSRSQSPATCCETRGFGRGVPFGGSWGGHGVIPVPFNAKAHPDGPVCGSTPSHAVRNAMPQPSFAHSIPWWRPRGFVKGLGGPMGMRAHPNVGGQHLTSLHFPDWKPPTLPPRRAIARWACPMSSMVHSIKATSTPPSRGERNHETHEIHETSGACASSFGSVGSRFWFSPNASPSNPNASPLLSVPAARALKANRLKCTWEGRTEGHPREVVPVLFECLTVPHLRTQAWRQKKQQRLASMDQEHGPKAPMTRAF